ncbi:hypothetical protein SAMN05892883_2361 [Jatrophihabitans sp. GAS493]|uniref:hypothetical protein n=1 Tax=Jatrophihabitans sp. GAS493 TaxID=1907575 RepID=UPI000BB6B52E|nr:hypothetical protein [Jatrophihabitans sp. GAS493]SOD73062.1 hypothetical protein SAMN05892883_2361 [Jatrophihabitans sp. GAS493]
MTAAAGGITADGVERLVGKARAVVQAVDELRSVAPTAADLDWADFRAARLHERWAALGRVMQRGDANGFAGTIEAIVSNGRPLDDAPVNMQKFISPLHVLLNDLAEEYAAVIEPLVEGNAFSEATLARFRELLPPLAPLPASPPEGR